MVSYEEFTITRVVTDFTVALPGAMVYVYDNAGVASAMSDLVTWFFDRGADFGGATASPAGLYRTKSPGDAEALSRRAAGWVRWRSMRC